MTNAKPRAGFIGVGLMGHGMAKNLIEGGYAMTVMGNRNRKPVEDLLERGAVEAASPADVGRNAEVVFLCLPGSPQIEQVVTGAEGLLDGMAEGSVIVDCSTADPVSTLKLAAAAAEKGVGFVDAPLSRTPKEAWEGTLDMMVGASDTLFDTVKPALECVAGKIVHIGAVGDGHKMKLLNNFVSLGYAALYSEALSVAAKSGIPREAFHSVIDGGRMDCGFYQTFMECAVGGNREAHKFTLTNALKDLLYLESMADAARVANPLGNAAKNSFAMAVSAGGGGAEDYVPHLADFVARRNGLTED